MDIQEIAKRARVSPATASRNIDRIPTVDPQLAKRVDYQHGIRQAVEHLAALRYTNILS